MDNHSSLFRGVPLANPGAVNTRGRGVRRPPTRSAAFAAALFLITASLPLHADEVRVMSSGGFASAYLDLVASFERVSSHRVVTDATSTGVGADSIPSRIRRGDPVDVVILPDAALSELIKEGRVLPQSRVPLARSGIGMAARAGAPKPDISSVEALTRALLQARSIAHSAQVSGLYLSNELFPRLGIADQLKPKIQVIERERVGAVVARGEASGNQT